MSLVCLPVSIWVWELRVITWWSAVPSVQMMSAIWTWLWLGLTGGVWCESNAVRLFGVQGSLDLRFLVWQK